jgi:glutathione peroxidase
MSDAIYDIPLKTIDGAPAKLADYARKDEGLTVLGFPANNFRGQEPGTEEEIAEFCSTTYGVDFPMFAKISVVGPDKHPLYEVLTKSKPETEGEGSMRERLKGFGIDSAPPPEVLWNFEKFLVGRDGKVAARFAPDMAVDDPRVTAAIDKALAQPA